MDKSEACIPTTRASVFGIACWPYGDSGYCRNIFEGAPGEAESSVEERATEAGWVIGHYDGQAYICCPDHRDAVYDPHPLRLREVQQVGSVHQSEMLIRILSAHENGLNTSILRTNRTAKALERRSWIKWTTGGSCGYGRWELTPEALQLLD